MRVVQVRVVETQQHVALVEQAAENPGGAGVRPEVRIDLQLARGRHLAQLLDEEGTVVAVQHANVAGLGKQKSDQVQLARERRVTPQQGDAQWLSAPQDLSSFDPVDLHDQGRRPFHRALAPVEQLWTDEDQAQIPWQVRDRRQLLGTGKLHTIIRPAGL
ncbi:hypothetical protein D3C77_554560 [compost metagenome]